MGYMTLENFREELSAVGGYSGPESRLNRWINFGYLDLAGAVNFNELDEVYDLESVLEQAGYNVPVGTRLVKTIANHGEDVLQYVDPSEYFRLDRGTVGIPLRWTRFGGSVYLHPTPSVINDFLVLRKIDPEMLEYDEDVSVLSNTWDAAIHYLAVYNMFIALHENEERANSWMMRAVTYIRTRATQEEMFVKESGLGLTYALPLEKRLAAMAESAQAAGMQG